MLARPGDYWITLLVVQASAVCYAVSPSDGSSAAPLVYQTWRTFTTRDGLPHDHIRTIYVSGDQVWIGTEGGLALREGDRFRSWTQQDGLVHPAVTAIDKDPKTNDLWLGTWGGGLVRFSAGRFDKFDQLDSGLAGNLVFAVAVVGDRVWAATNAGISSYDPINNRWGLYVERRSDAPEVVMTSLSRIGDGIVAGAWCGGVWRFDEQGDRWTVVSTAPDHSVRKRISSESLRDTTVGTAAAGRALWWTTQTELFRRVSDRPWEGRAIPIDGFPGRFVYGLACPSETEAWFGTDRGLQVLTDWDTNTWVTYRRCESERGGVVTVTRNGRVVGSGPTAAAIPDNQTRCIAFKGKDVWVGTVNGLALGTGLKPWDVRRLPGKDEERVAQARCSSTARKAFPLQPPADDPIDVSFVNIGVLGPLNRSVALPGLSVRRTEPNRADLLAVQIAVQDANARGGYRGKVPFALVLGSSGYEDYAWTTPEDEFSTFAYDDHVLGLVGCFGTGSKIATAVALRTEVPIVNAASTPLAVHESIVPWIFRCFGDEPRQQRALLDYIFDRLEYRRLAVLRTPGRLTDIHLDWWVSHAQDRGHPVVSDVNYDPRVESLDTALQALQRLQVDAVLTWCDVDTSAVILQRMREVGMEQLLVCSDQIVNDRFVRLVGTDPGPIIAAYPITERARLAVLGDFAKKYAEQTCVGLVRHPPGPEACFAYDATRHLLRAINIAGPDHSAIRRTLAAMSFSASGERHFEETHSPGTPMFARLREGKWRFHPLPRR